MPIEGGLIVDAYEAVDREVLHTERQLKLI